MAIRAFNPFTTYLTPDGAVSAGDKFYFYAAGTSTPKTIYSDAGGITPISNPVVANSRGQIQPVYIDGSYRVVRYDSSGVELQDIDNIGTDSLQVAFEDWDSILQYNSGDIVKGSNGLYYVSIINSNTNNNPVSVPAAWSQIMFVFVYNANQTYVIGDIVRSGDEVYQSKVNANTGNTPSSSPAQWKRQSHNPAIQDSWSAAQSLPRQALGNQSSTVAWNMANGVGGFTVTLTGNAAISNPTGTPTLSSNGYISFLLTITQDATGGRTPTWGANWKNLPAISTTANAVTVISGVYDGTHFVIGGAVTK